MINQYETEVLITSICEKLCINSYNESRYNATVNGVYNDATLNQIVNSIDSTQYIYHSVCDNFMVEHTYKLFELLDKNHLFDVYKVLLHRLLTADDSFYWHINTAMLYVALYLLIINKVIHCTCIVCSGDNDA